MNYEGRNKMSSKNGYFQLVIKDDGLYIKLFEAELGGQAINFDEIHKYLSDVKIYDYDKIAISRALGNLNGTVEVKLSSSTILPQDERLKIQISEDRLYAKGRFYPPSNNGKLMTKDDIIHSMASAGIKYGVDEHAGRTGLYRHGPLSGFIPRHAGQNVACRMRPRGRWQLCRRGA